jgi:hypothetical protein
LRVARLYALRCQLEQEPASAEGEVSRPSGRALAVEQALIAVTGDEHAGRKHQHCPQLGRGSLAGELEALTPALTPPPLSLAGDGESAEP